MGHMRGRIPQEDPMLLLLPQPKEWKSLQDVADYARACIEVCGPPGWDVVWDRAVKRLGCCMFNRRVLSFSRFFVQTYLDKDQELIRRTVLHELAHALAWEKYRERGHGPAWHRACCALGIADERSVCKCDDFAPPERQKKPTYALCHAITGEVYRYYYRKPNYSAYRLRLSYIPGQRAQTLGKLKLIDLREQESQRDSSDANSKQTQ